MKRAKNDAGDPIGRRHANPKMDTREYEVEFIDGTTERYSANIVAENIYSQCDSEGNQYLVLKEIIDHKSDESALRVGDGYTVGRNGNLHQKDYNSRLEAVVRVEGWFHRVDRTEGDKGQLST